MPSFSSSPRLSPRSDVVSLPDDDDAALSITTGSLVDVESVNGDSSSHAGSLPVSPSRIRIGASSSDPPSGPASLFSPALSSSAPSSANFENEGLSDVSSLDEHDFDFIEAELLRRPASALSGRSSTGWSSQGRSTAARPRAPSLSEGLPDPLALLSPRPERQPKTEADALSSSLGSTYGFFRAGGDEKGNHSLEACPQHSAGADSSGWVAPTPRESQTWAVGGSALTSASTMRGSRAGNRTTPRQSSLLARAFEAPDGAATSSESPFEFPDPLSESFRTSVAEEKRRVASPDLSASDAFSILTGSDVHPPGESGLRNPWRAPGSTRSKGTQHSMVAPQSSPSVMDSELTSSRIEELRRRSASEVTPTVLKPVHAGDETQADEATDAEEPSSQAYPSPDSSGRLNLFFLGRKMHPHLVSRISAAVRQSLLQHFDGNEGQDEASFKTVRREQSSGPVAVSEFSAALSGGRTVLLREYDSTVPIGSSADATLSITTWLRTVGQAEVQRGGALIICLLESGEQPPLDLVLTLSALLKRRGHGLDVAQYQAIVLPILCPRAPSNLDDGDSSIELGGDTAGDVTKELARSFRLRSMEHQWRRMLLSADCALTESMKLRITSGSGDVIAFESLLRDAPACFGGNDRWAAQAATEIRPDPLARAVAGVGAPLWLVRTAAWLKAHKPVDMEQQAAEGAITLTASSFGHESSTSVSSAAAAMAAALEGGLEGGASLRGQRSPSDKARFKGLHLREGVLAALVVLLSSVVALLSYQGGGAAVRLTTGSSFPAKAAEGRGMPTPAPGIAQTLPAAAIHGVGSLVPSRHAPSVHTASAPSVPGFILKSETQLSASSSRSQRALSRRLRSAADKSLSVIPNRTSDLAIYHFIDANSLVLAQDWLSVPISTAMAVSAMRRQPQALERFVASSREVALWLAKTAQAIAEETFDEMAFWIEELGDFFVHVVVPPIQKLGEEIYTASRETVHTINVATAPARKAAAQKSIEMAQAALEAAERLDKAVDGAVRRRHAYEKGAEWSKQASDAALRAEREVEKRAQEAKRAFLKAKMEAAAWTRATKRATAKVLKKAQKKRRGEETRARKMGRAVARESARARKAAVQGVKLAEDAGKATQMRAEEAARVLAERAGDAKKVVRAGAKRASEGVREAWKRAEVRRKEKKTARARRREEQRVMDKGLKGRAR